MKPIEEKNFKLEKMTQAEINEVIRRHVMFLSAIPGGARAVVRDRDLSGLNFTGQNLAQSDFTGCILRGAIMNNASFESATLFGCDLRGALLQGARLMRVDLRGAEVDEADMQKADLTGADLREGKTVIKRKIRHTEDQYSKAAEAGIVHLLGCNLTDAILTGVLAMSADFTDAQMGAVDLTGANLKGAVLRGADLSNSKIDNADLRDADFTWATLTGASLNKTEKSGSNFTLALTADTVGTSIEEMELTLDELVLRHIQWVATAGRYGAQLVLNGVDMRKAGKLAAQKLTAVRAQDATFAEMDLRGIELQAASLNGSDFRKCLLAGSDLRGSRFAGCLMNRADLRRANLNPLTIRRREDAEEYQLPCVFDNAHLRHVNFAGARLMEASFFKADLTGADFSDCDLRRSDFRGAKLLNARFDNALLEDALFDLSQDPRRRLTAGEASQPADIYE